MQPTSPAAMSGGAAVKAENRGMVRAHGAQAEEPRSPGSRPKGLALTGLGPQAPNKKGSQPEAVRSEARGIVTGWRRPEGASGVQRVEPGPAPAGRATMDLQHLNLVSCLERYKLMFMNGEEDLPEPSAPESFPVSARGFADATEAEDFARYIALTVRLISQYMDLSRLDGITVAFDYDDALAELDRGYEPSRPLTRTSGDRMIGVAMAPAVIRDGVVKAHLVFCAPFVLPIKDEKHEYFSQALYLVAHECAHIAELKCRDERFPGKILQVPITDREEEFFAPIVESLWTEYAACRLSAVFGREQASAYEECFVGALEAARDEANTAIRAYRWHGDVNRVIEDAGRPLVEPLRLAAYLIGHIDGRGGDWDAAPTARDRLAASEYADSIGRMAEVLREIWSKADSWESPKVFDPLKEIAREVLKQGGIILTRQADGSLYADIPFTIDTLPT